MDVSHLERITQQLAAGVGVDAMRIRHHGKERVVLSPSDESVRNVHRRILALLTPAQMELPELVSGYVRGRSSLTNASAHVGHRYLQKFDLQDFFPHITRAAVEAGLGALGLQNDVATLLAGLTTCRGRLPVGFSTSPAVANLSCFELDQGLTDIAYSVGVTVTRYADDIAFSGHDAFDVTTAVHDLVSSAGHQVNEGKTRTLKRGQPMYVTGLSLSEPGRVRLPRPFKRRLRQELYYIEAWGLESHARRISQQHDSVRFRLGGQLAYSAAIEPQWTASLRTAFPSAYASVARSRSHSSDEKRRQRLQFLADRIRNRDDRRAPSYTPAKSFGLRQHGLLMGAEGSTRCPELTELHRPLTC